MSAIGERLEAALGAVQLPFGIQRLEIVGHFAGGFAGAQQHQSAGIEREIEKLQHLALQNRLQVDQQIAATEQGNVGKRRILDQIMLSEHHHFPDGTGDLEIVLILVEILGQQARRNVGGDAFGISAVSGVMDGVAINISGKNLDIVGNA